MGAVMVTKSRGTALQHCRQKLARHIDAVAGAPLRTLGRNRKGGLCMWTRNHKGNVFVGNLPRDFADERLAEAFDPYGIVLSAMVARDPATGERLRYGFVDIATDRAANAAIAGLNGKEVDGCKLNVKMSEKPAKKAAGAGPSPRRRDPVRRAVPQQRRPAF